MLLLLLACAGDDTRVRFDDGPIDGAVRVESLPAYFLAGEDGEHAGTEALLGDLTGDGRADAVVGPVIRTHSGYTGPAVAVMAAPFVGEAQLTSGRTIGVVGADTVTARLLADLDEDGTRELVVHAVQADEDERHSTALVVVSGPLTGDVWWPDAADVTTRVTLPEADGWLSSCPVVTGDLSRDGAPDLLTCARFETGGAGSATRGAVVLLDGPFTAEPAAELEPRTLFAAPASDDGYGAGLAVAGLSGGGLDWAIVTARGTPGDPEHPPAVYLYEAAQAGVIEAGDADGRLVVDDGAGALDAPIVASDLDGDGYPDLAVVADPTGDRPRTVFVVLGPPSAASLADGIRAWDGEIPADEPAPTLLAPGDVDGDGNPDLAVGASTEETPDPGGGVVRILYGPFPTESVAAVYGAADTFVRGDGGVAVHQQRLGAALATGDVEGDGAPELLLGSPGFSNDRSGVEPGAFLLLGGSW